LAEWNALNDDLARLFAEYRSAPRARATMEAACYAYNAVNYRRTDMTWAITDPHSPDEAGDQVRVLRWHVERLARALERDPSRRGKRGSSDIEAPDLRLADTVEAVKAQEDGDE
jgi:hypothetical protein